VWPTIVKPGRTSIFSCPSISRAIACHNCQFLMDLKSVVLEHTVHGPGRSRLISVREESEMTFRSAVTQPVFLAIALSSFSFGTRALAADIRGQVLGAGMPITESTVTLFAASAGAPKQLAQTKTDGDGRFVIRGTGGYRWRGFGQ
jgi:hypothetical protein